MERVSGILAVTHVVTSGKVGTGLSLAAFEVEPTNQYSVRTTARKSLSAGYRESVGSGQWHAVF